MSPHLRHQTRRSRCSPAHHRHRLRTTSRPRPGSRSQRRSLPGRAVPTWQLSAWSSGAPTSLSPSPAGRREGLKSLSNQILFVRTVWTTKQSARVTAAKAEGSFTGSEHICVLASDVMSAKKQQEQRRPGQQEIKGLSQNQHLDVSLSLEKLPQQRQHIRRCSDDRKMFSTPQLPPNPTLSSVPSIEHPTPPSPTPSIDMKQSQLCPCQRINEPRYLGKGPQEAACP